MWKILMDISIFMFNYHNRRCDFWKGITWKLKFKWKKVD